MTLNPLLWYVDRELSFIPSHFVKANTPMTEDSLFWVRSKLIGRYGTSAVTGNTVEDYIFGGDDIYFEDPAEAMIYELRWSGNK
jgi:hypothetical protein